MKHLIFTLFLSGASVYAQDIITFRNGDEIRARVLEISSSEIRYKRFDNLEGPTIVVPRNDVFFINYENGKRETITSLSEPSGVATNVVQTETRQNQPNTARAERVRREPNVRISRNTPNIETVRNNNEFSGYSFGVLVGTADEDILLGLNATYNFNRHYGLNLALRHHHRYSYFDGRYGGWGISESRRRHSFLGPVFNMNWWSRGKFYLFTNAGFGVLWSRGHEYYNRDQRDNYSFNYSSISGAIFGSTGLGFKPNNTFSMKLGFEGAFAVIGRFKPQNNYFYYYRIREDYGSIFININFYLNSKNR